MPRGDPRRVSALRLTPGEEEEIARGAKRFGLPTLTYTRIAAIALSRIPKTQAKKLLEGAQQER